MRVCCQFSLANRPVRALCVPHVHEPAVGGRDEVTAVRGVETDPQLGVAVTLVPHLTHEGCPSPAVGASETGGVDP